MATSLTTGQPDNYGLLNGGSTTAPRVDTRVASSGGATTSSGASGTSTVAGTTGQSGTSNTQGTTNQVQTTNQVTQNMTPAQQAQLASIIQMLMGGGTPEMRASAAARRGETATVQGIRSGYSKEAAFADAEGLIAQQMRRALESMLPSINRAAEDAGSSGGALRALLLQDAADKASQSASALGVQTAGTYGNISTGLSQVLENLTRTDPTVANALIAALNVAKGSVVTTNGTVQTTGTTNQTTNSSQAGNSNQTTNSNEGKVASTNENKNVFTDYAPLVAASAPVPTYDPITNPVANTVGTTQDTLQQLWGASNNPWASYQL